MPALTGTNALYQDHFLEIKKWQEEKVQNLRRMQKAQMEMLEAEKRRVDELLKEPLQKILNVSRTKEQTCKNSLTTEGVSTSKHNPHAEKCLQEKVKVISDIPGNEVQKQNKMPSVTTFTSPITGTAVATTTATPVTTVCGTKSSFEELIERQMQKLQISDGEKSTSSTVSSNKPKRPFLKKRTGLLKYTTKSDTSKASRQTKAKKSLPPEKLSLKPILQTSGSVQKSVKVHFDLPSDNSSVSVLPSVSGFSQTTGTESVKSNQQQVASCDSSVGNEKEIRELKEFELLENASENASFCSESSFVQDVLQQNAKQGKVAATDSPGSPREIQGSALDELDPAELAKCISGLKSRSKCLQERLLSIQSSCLDLNTTATDVNKQDIGNVRDSSTSTFINRCRNFRLDNGKSSNSDSSSCGSSVIGSDINAAVVAVCGPDESMIRSPQLSPDAAGNNALHPEISNDLASDEDSETSDRSIYIKRLKREISIYEKSNAELASLNRQREEEIKALKKQHEEFEKFKEEELKNIEKVVTEKRNQIRREKQTFERYQKLRKDVPGKKEREESLALKQQVVTLQEELKKQSIKSNAECKRLRSLLASAEKERDSLKMENERLEAQRINLLEALKAKQKTLKTSAIGTKKNDVNQVDSEPVELPENSDSPERRHDSGISEHLSERQDVNVTPSPKQHVRFNLEPSIQNFSPSDSVERNYHEIQHPDKVERIFQNGEKEIYYSSGTTEYISADGQHKTFIFYNGDTKEVFPDKRMVYKFRDGTVETHFPDGLQVYEYANHQVERYYPDGTSRVDLPNGSTIVVYSDGAQEVHTYDGIVIKSFTDGMHAVEYPCGDKEIRTSDYIKREFANGTVRTVYRSGRTETIYPDGRLKVKDKEGRVILDVKN